MAYGQTDLIDAIRRLSRSDVRDQVQSRLECFKGFVDKPSEEWFSELCFCILTANSKASTAISIQEELGPEGFICKSQGFICSCIRRNKHRFHNNKSRYIVEARKHRHHLKSILSSLALKDQREAREWLVKNVKGLGYKEASHFLRNVGYHDLAILDRHILNIMHDYGFLKELVKPTKRDKYLEIEGCFRSIADKLRMSLAEVDFYMWYMRTGKVLK